MVRLLIFTKIGAEFQCGKAMVRGPMFTKVGPEFQC